MIKIADIKIDCGRAITSDSQRFKKFSSFGFGASLKSKVRRTTDLYLSESAQLIVKDEWDWGGVLESLEWYKSDDNWILLFLTEDKIAGKMVMSNDYRRASIEFNGQFLCSDYSIAESFISIQFRNYILQRDGLIFHASAIKVNDQGLLISAPSGTGKSTHASLWEKHRNAIIFNDDSPAIRILDDGVYAYGTPWSGSSDKYENVKVPIRAIVLLEQGLINKAVRLQPFEAVSRVMPMVFLPFQDEKMMLAAMTIVERIITSVPIYLLRCTPDLEAVEVLESALYAMEEI